MYRNLEDAIFSDEPNMFKVPTYRDEEKCNDYFRAIGIAYEYKKKGFLDFKYETPDKPYFITSIYIEWNSEEWSEPDPVKLSRLISLADSIILDGHKWELGFEMYHPVH